MTTKFNPHQRRDTSQWLLDNEHHTRTFVLIWRTISELDTPEQILDILIIRVEP